jgi:hypothetical protein
VEAIEAGFARRARDPGDLVVERVADGRLGARVDLELLGDRVDVVAQLFEQRRIGEARRQDAAGQKHGLRPHVQREPRAGLVARIVEPIAPNLAALRRVSSKAERAYVSISSPCAMSVYAR